MKPFAVAVLVVIALAFYVTAEAPHQSSATVAVAPYEIVQLSSATQVTLRVNKFNGETDFLFEAAPEGKTAKELVWNFIARLPHKDDKIKPEGPNYQVYIAGIGNSVAYLLNVHTGATWVLSAIPGPHQAPKLTWTPMSDNR